MTKTLDHHDLSIERLGWLVFFALGWVTATVFNLILARVVFP